MRGDIESVLTLMSKELTFDIIKHIVFFVHQDVNKKTIVKQKMLKKKMMLELVKYFNIFYHDKNIILFRNENNDVVLENITNKYNDMYLYSNINNIQNTNIINNNLIEYNHIANEISNTSNEIISHVNTAETRNEVVLFKNTNTTVLDENGFEVQRRIKLYIVYI